MNTPQLPNPLTDELSDDAKAALAQIFASLRWRFSGALRAVPTRRQWWER